MRAPFFYRPRSPWIATSLGALEQDSQQGSTAAKKCANSEIEISSNYLSLSIRYGLAKNKMFP
jgi:hypothetical protein